MKNIITTSGMAAVAVVGFQTTCGAQAVTVDESKCWSIGASLRGFYDDNYTAAPKGQEQDSFGVEVRPTAMVSYQGEQFMVKASAIYAARWFEDRSSNEVDHNVLADIAGEYRLTENHILRVNDTFSWTSEGTLLDQNGIVTFPFRSNNTNLRNLGDIRYVGQFTPLIGLELGYQNTFYDFDQDGPGSYSAILDRQEHLMRAETRWTVTPTMAAILGYWYEIVDFNANEALSPTGIGLTSDSRNSHSHFIVGGVDYTLSPQAFLSVRGGAQDVIYDNVPGEPDEWNPFGDISGTYEYLPGSYFRVGGKYGRNRTDVVTGVLTYDNLTLDEETGTVYGVVNHKITESLSARASGQFQYGEFKGGSGSNDGAKEGVYLMGFSLVWDIGHYLAVEGGYNYDRVDSDDRYRSYSRNRVFLGVRGQF